MESKLYKLANEKSKTNWGTIVVESSSNPVKTLSFLTETQPEKRRNYLSRTKKYVRLAEQGIIYGKTKEEWKKFAAENAKTLNKIPSIEVISKKKKEKKSFKQLQAINKRLQTRNESMETLKFVDLMIEACGGKK